MFSTRAIGTAAISICAGFAVTTSSADVFQRVLGDGDREHTYSIENTDDGGYITTGFRDAGPAASPDENVLITKHFADGTVEWQRLWAGPGRDIGYSVQQTFDGGYIVAAETTSSGDPFVQHLLIRLDPTGALVWNNFYLGSFMTDPIHTVQPGVALDQGFNGQIYVVGSLGGVPQISAIDPAGLPIWSATYTDPVTDPFFAARFAFTDIKHDPTNSTLVVSGTTLRNESTPPTGAIITTQDAFLLRVDGVGAPIWVWNYDFPADLDPTSEAGYNVRETGDGLDISPTGRIILNGTTDFGGPAVGSGTHLVEVDPAGFPIWGREYNHFSPDGIVSGVTPGYAAVRFDGENNIVQAGRNRSFGGFVSAVEWLTDPVGSPLWFWEYGVGNNSQGESVVPHPECGYAMAGQFEFLPPLAPFARGETFLVKNDDNGETGCAEIAWDVVPDFNVNFKQNGIVPDYLDKIMNAPNLLIPVEAFDNALCYDAGCGDTPCPCDINGDGVLDLVDITLFISCFTGALPCGDLAPPFGVWDLSDVGLFITCFTGGC